MTDKRPTIAELERILSGPNDKPITILPNGEIRVLDQPDTVYAHVERTVHALLEAIAAEIPHRDELTRCDRVKTLAEAVQALSSWPQFNPMNAHEQYEKLAEYEVERALKARRVAMPCACGFGSQDRRLHTSNCPRVGENLEIPLP